jgi:hypothetical protein
VESDHASPVRLAQRQIPQNFYFLIGKDFGGFVWRVAMPSRWVECRAEGGAEQINKFVGKF